MGAWNKVRALADTLLTSADGVRNENPDSKPSPWRAVKRRVRRRLKRGRKRPVDVKPKPRTKKKKKRTKPKPQRADWTPYYQLAALIEGRSQRSVTRKMAKRAPTAEQHASAREQFQSLQMSVQFVESLRLGDDLGRALVEFARRTSAFHGEISRPLIEALVAHGPGKDEATVARAVLAARMGLRPFADELFSTVPLDKSMRLASHEFFAVKYWADATAAHQAAEVLLDREGVFGVEDYLAVFEAAFAARDYAIADRALRRIETAEEDAPGGKAAKLPLSWYRRWMDAANQPQRLAAAAPGRVPFAVLSYQQPDLSKTSSNLGDYTQTVSALGHLLRHKNLRFHGDPEVVEPVERLRIRVRPERLLDTAAADVQLHLVHRDASLLDSLPPGTWMLAFGWYMSSMFQRRYDFPLHPCLLPIFVSFHVNRRHFLTPDAIAYLKAHGPVGCRDWSTTYLLLSAGVEAFFSGCLTTTIDTLFPETTRQRDPQHADGSGQLYVDVKPVPVGAASFRQERREVKTNSFAENLDKVVETLEWYAGFEQIVTSRLHSYLPSRALNLPVEFRAKRPSDIRFGGLVGISDQEFETLREGLLEKLAAVIELIIGGASRDAVYQRWADLCAPDVARAKERFQRPASVPPRAKFDIERETARILARRVDLPRTSHESEGSEVRIEVSMDGNLRHQLTVVLDALEAHSDRPLHLFLLSRGYSEADHERMARLFPRVSFSWLPCDDVDYGDQVYLLRHLTVATMDRVLLPALLTEVDRIIHLDLDTLPCDDIGKLYDFDLQGTPLAARSTLRERTSSGVGVFFQHVARVPPERASEFLRTILMRHGYDYAPFSAGVMLLDLARLRQDKFCETFIPYLEEYGLHDQQLLNLYAGPNRATLEPRWNTFPRQELATDPAILHWAGPAKPWNPEYVRFKEDWQRAEQRLATRVARTFGASD